MTALLNSEFFGDILRRAALTLRAICEVYYLVVNVQLFNFLANFVEKVMTVLCWHLAAAVGKIISYRWLIPGVLSKIFNYAIYMKATVFLCVQQLFVECSSLSLGGQFCVKKLGCV